MKILFTSFAYYPETSGVPIVIQYLAEGLVHKGHSVSVATRVNGKHLSAHEVINGVNLSPSLFFSILVSVYLLLFLFFHDFKALIDS